MFTFRLLLLALLYASCTNQQSSCLLSTESLPKQRFRINTKKDTVLKTTNGALLEIAKESFSSDEVELVVQEAYPFDDNLKAGLTTMSNGKPLRSGGTIKIEATEKRVKVLKPIRLSLPTKDLDGSMRVFTGEERWKIR
ncbi:MAG TPA: hypothetical protein VM871_00780, partial [Flavisolibacter sp.]|nr:hypothetical protein [Flavisolibacter sp.]